MLQTQNNNLGPAQNYNGQEEDNRDEFWRQNFINYNSWKKEDKAILKNKKIPRASSKNNLNNPFANIPKDD
jgi:hypothetical protein